MLQKHITTEAEYDNIVAVLYWGDWDDVDYELLGSYTLLQ